jgi:hypothetical protein
MRRLYGNDGKAIAFVFRLRMTQIIGRIII